jgi:tyrosyl-tRNA synthetase
MKFSVSKEVFSKIEDLTVGFLVVEGLEVKDGKAEEVAQALKEVEAEIKAENIDPESLEVVKNFDKAFEALGLGKDGVRVSIFNMLKMISKGKSLVFNQPIIDFYNAFVLSENLPAGGYDLDRVVGDVEVRFSNDSDRFIQLNKDQYKEVGEDVVVFADESEVLCSHWVWKQADTQKLRPRTQNVLFRFEGLGETEKSLKAKLKVFESELKKYFKFKSFDYVLVTEGSSEAEIKLSKSVKQRQERYLDSFELLDRGVSNVIVRDEVVQDLIDGKKLRIKHGVDPTTKDLHLGYAVIYEKLRQFQERGHKIVFLIGTFTARFGDPTDKGDTRAMKDKKDVVKMAKNYVKQLGRILDTKKVEFVYNGDWFDKMSAEDLLRIMSEFTVAGMLERDMFDKRMKEGKGIGLHEIVYPVLQGYDSVEIKSDLTVIGTDQTFNELQARPLQQRRGQDPQDIIAMDLLVGTDGTQKMSQSLGNYIGFDDTPEDKFGKVMSIPDHVIVKYFEVCTRVSMSELEDVKSELESGVNPRDVKMRLAHEIVSIYDGEKAAAKAKDHFVTVFQKGETPDEIPVFALNKANNGVLDVLNDSGLCSSKSEARRMIEQGGVRVDGDKLEDIEFEFEAGKEYLLQVGKRKFVKVKS